MAKVTNDQGHIIQAIRAKQYDLVWEKIKWIGYATIKDINDRYLIFYEVVRKFDPAKNNNFIHWYKSRLSYVSSYDFKGNRCATSRSTYHKMINEYISPTANSRGSHLVSSRKNWR